MASIAGVKAENAALRSELITLRQLRAQDAERIKLLEKQLQRECDFCQTVIEGGVSKRVSIQAKLPLEVES